MKIKEYVRNFCLVSIPTFLLLFLLLELVVFKYFISVSDALYYRLDDDFEIVKFDHVDVPVKGIYTQGPLGKHKVTWQVNSDGWLSDEEYIRGVGDPVIAVIGDSYIEAKQVNSGESYPHLLNEMFGDSMVVYGFGMAGTPLSHYLHMARYAQHNFDPDVFVINLIHNDFSESLSSYANNAYGSWYWTMEQQGDSFVMQRPRDIDGLRRGDVLINKDNNYWLKNSATFRYLEYNVKLGGKIFLKQIFKRKKVKHEENIDVRQDLVKQNAIRRVSAHVVRQFKKEFPNKRIIFVMDGVRNAIYRGDIEKSSAIWLNTLMAEICSDQDFEFIDLTKPFQKDYEQNHIRFEFKTDAHWNAYTHRLVADTLYNYLSQPHD